MKTTKLDYQNGNIGKLFRSLFFPTLIGMLSNSVFLITDGIFVGQGIGPLGLAAVNMVAPMFILICGITLMFGIGSSVDAEHQGIYGDDLYVTSNRRHDGNAT